MADIIIAVLAVVIVGTAIYRGVKSMKSGNSSCGCGCSGCSSKCQCQEDGKKCM
ncbi:MAG: FeoB-associated Cys-rich membrane protein [Lachnospiraceae bacterium]|nr:FeoB-associated Cys-rich membrane protein [Lachnospiraceae bacterium]